jgi:UDP-N-acetylmuramate--alanine ligase
MQNKATNKTPVAVVLGGYSSERHISVESGRNIYEKLASSEKYAPVPVFLTGNSNAHKLYKVPINALLKDNADDIKEKVESWKVHDVIKQIVSECSAITDKYAAANAILEPKEINYTELSKRSERSIYCPARPPRRRW